MLITIASRWKLKPASGWRGYALAVLLVAVAAAVRWAAAVWVAASPNFPVFYPAVLIATLVGGKRAGWLALGLSTATVWWFWLPLLHSLPLDRPQLITAVMFGATAGLMIAVSETARRAYFRALAADERFRLAHEASLDGFIMLEPVRRDGRIVDFRWGHANAAAEAMAPASARPLVGSLMTDVFPETGENDLLQRYVDILKSGKPDKFEFKLTIDGAEHWMSSSGVRIEDAVALTFRDVTAAIEARKSLEARVEERTRALEQTREERAKAEAALAQAQRVETLGRLTGGVAHDFNNILTVIIGGLDMILRGVDKPERVKRLAETALAAGRRGERLTRQLLAFSRHREIKLEVHKAAEIMGQVEPMIRRAAGEMISLTIEVAANAGSARFDGAQFEAALLNLVVNAAHATPPGGSIKVTASRARVAVGEIEDLKEGRYLKVSVADTGTGIPPEVMQRIFEPFFTTKEIGQGSGLGLAQVQGFARQSGGAVTVESQPGQGATINIYLPAADGPARELTIPPVYVPTQARRVTGETVLLVEDDEGVRTLTESLLEECGFRVLSTENGPEALAILRRGDPIALMLSDVVMPGGMSGVDLAILASRLRPELPILLATGYAAGRLAELTPANDWPVLRKPFHLEELAAAIRDALAAKGKVVA